MKNNIISLRDKFSKKFYNSRSSLASKDDIIKIALDRIENDNENAVYDYLFEKGHLEILASEAFKKIEDELNFEEFQEFFEQNIKIDEMTFQDAEAVIAEAKEERDADESARIDAVAFALEVAAEKEYERNVYKN